MNRSVFADTSFFVAGLNRRDSHHAAAVRLGIQFSGFIITTQWVLVELANYFAKTQNRHRVINFVDDLLADPEVECIAASNDIFRDGWNLYRKRLDKEWSLTDCISFEIMRQRGLDEALTTDHHFEQAGFRILLK